MSKSKKNKLRKKNKKLKEQNTLLRSTLNDLEASDPPKNYSDKLLETRTAIDLLKKKGLDID